MEITLTATARKPLTPGAWLQRSIAWTLACAVGWLLASIGLANVLNTNEAPGKMLLLGTAGAAHLLIWFKALLSSPEAADTPEPFWLTTAGALWTFLLLLFQVLCLLLWFLGLILACDTSRTWQ